MTEAWEISKAALLEAGRADLAEWMSPGRSGAPTFERRVIGERVGMAGISFEDYLLVSRAIDIGRESVGMRRVGPVGLEGHRDCWEHWQGHPVLEASDA